MTSAIDTLARGAVLLNSRNTNRYLLLEQTDKEVTVIVCDEKMRSRNQKWTTENKKFFSVAPITEQLESRYWRAGGKFNMELYLKYLERRIALREEHKNDK